MTHHTVRRGIVAAAVSVTAALCPPATPATADEGSPVSGRVWFDRDQDGVADAGEPGRAYAAVAVSQGATVVTTVRADRDGRYAITGLAQGDYQLTNRSADGYLATTPATVDVHVDDARQVDFGISGARLTGTVWADTNGDGRRQPAEAAMPIPQQIQLEGNGFGTTRRPVSDTGRFAFDDLPALDHYVLFAPDRSASGEEFTVPGANSAIDPATGGSAPFGLRTGQSHNLDIGYRPTRSDLTLAELPVLNAAAGRPVDVVARITNHGADATDFQVEISTPAGVRVTGRKGVTRAGESTAPLAPGAVTEVRFTLVGDRSLTGAVTVTVGASTQVTTLNVTAARKVTATHAPMPQGAVAAGPRHLDDEAAPAQAEQAHTGRPSVISVVLASVLVAASGALVMVLRRRVAPTPTSVHSGQRNAVTRSRRGRGRSSSPRT